MAASIWAELDMERRLGERLPPAVQGAWRSLDGRSFQSGNPLLLSLTGEFVIKNLVLIAAGLAIGSTVRRRAPASRGQTPAG